MGKLQERAKPYIVPFLQCRWPVLDEWATRSLAAWITMFTMVFEFSDPTTAAISFEQRDNFRRTRDPINDWKIWIAKINPYAWRGKIFHNGFGIYDVGKAPANARLDAQITTAVIGNLLIHSFYAPADLFVVELTPAYDARLGLTRIWPAKHTPPHCPVRILTDSDAENIRLTLASFISKLPTKAERERSILKL
jgi:hypothetical protein